MLKLSALTSSDKLDAGPRWMCIGDGALMGLGEQLHHKSSPCTNVSPAYRYDQGHCTE